MVTRRFLALAFAAGLSCAPAVAQELPAGNLPSQGEGVGEGPALIVANKQENSVSRILLATGEEAQRSPSCANPHELALSPDGDTVALACYGGSTIELFRAADLTRLGEIELGEGARPHGLVWHENGALIASAQGRGSVFVVREPLAEAPQLTEIAVSPGGPHMVAVSADGATAWGTVVDTGEVVRIDLMEGEVTHRRVLGGNTEGLSLAPGGTPLWVGANSADRLYRLNPGTLATEAEIATGSFPIRVAAHPEGRWIVTSNLRDGTLSVIDARSSEVARTIDVTGSGDAGQVTLVFSADGSRLYLAETFAATVAEIDFASGRVLRRLPAGQGGDGLAIAP